MIIILGIAAIVVTVSIIFASDKQFWDYLSKRGDQKHAERMKELEVQQAREALLSQERMQREMYYCEPGMWKSVMPTPTGTVVASQDHKHEKP